MSIKDLQKLRKTEIREHTEEYVPYLVVGGDLWSATAAMRLSQEHGEGQVKLVGERALAPEDLELLGPDLIRGEKGVVPLFYKDQEFRKFGGRAKPQVLHPGEEFFSRDAIPGKQEEALRSLGELSLEHLNKLLHVGLVEKVESRDPTDLVSPAHWVVQLASGHRILCKELVWGQSPKSFLEKFAEKSRLPTSFVQYVDSTRAPAALFVRYQLKKVIDQRPETFFIPLSMTYEEGHFIGQFRGQNLEFVYFLDPEHVDEENLSKNVRHLRKNVEKIFPDFEKNLVGEYIRLTENWACQKVDDQAYFHSHQAPDHLRLIGTNAPIKSDLNTETTCEDSICHISHLARALQSIEDLGKQLP